MDGVIQNLVEALAAWLRFEVACGRSSLLTEASLAQPLVQSAQAQGLRLKREHGVAPPAGGRRGRPRSIDYVFVGRSDKPWLYLEAKFYKFDPRGILADCNKLLEQKTAHRYLLLAGVGKDSFRKAIGQQKLDFLSEKDPGWRCVDSSTKAWSVWQKLRSQSDPERTQEQVQQAQQARWQFQTRLVHCVETEHNREYAMAGIWQLGLSPGAGRKQQAGRHDSKPA